MNARLAVQLRRTHNALIELRARPATAAAARPDLLGRADWCAAEALELDPEDPSDRWSPSDDQHTDRYPASWDY